MINMPRLIIQGSPYARTEVIGAVSSLDSYGRSDE